MGYKYCLLVPELCPQNSNNCSWVLCFAIGLYVSSSFKIHASLSNRFCFYDLGKHVWYWTSKHCDVIVQNGVATHSLK